MGYFNRINTMCVKCMKIEKYSLNCANGRNLVESSNDL